MNLAQERARYDLALQYCAQSLSRMQKAFNTDSKVSNIILAQAFIQNALAALGPDVVSNTLRQNPDVQKTLNILQEEQMVDQQRLVKIVETETEVISEDERVVSREGNVLTVKF